MERGRWTAGHVATLDLNGIATESGYVEVTPKLDLGGLTFERKGATRLFLVEGILPDLYDWGSGGVLAGGYGQPTTLKVHLPMGTTAWGADFMGFYPDPKDPNGDTWLFPISVHIALGDGTFFNLATHGYPTHTFYGFVSDAPIGFVELSSSRLPFGGGLPVENALLLDDVAYNVH